MGGWEEMLVLLAATIPDRGGGIWGRFGVCSRRIVIRPNFFTAPPVSKVSKSDLKPIIMTL